MISFNHVILTGKVVTLPRCHFRPDGSQVIQFPLELNDSKDLSGHRNRSQINIVAFGKLSEYKFNLIKNGQYLIVVGRLNERHWQTPEGKSRTRMEVIATDLQALEEMNLKKDSNDRGGENEKTG
jgi:single-strand DNA-binding protein